MVCALTILVEFAVAYRVLDPTLRVSAVPLDDLPQSPGRECLAKDFSVRTAAPERFPKPFQNRPPGQFHLPWTPEISPSIPSATLPDTHTPTSPGSSSTSGDNFTVKVILDEAIVLLRVPLNVSLAELRGRIAEKYSKQEGVHVSPSFSIGYILSPSERATSPKGRPRSNSTSSNLAIQSVRYITAETEWRSVIDNCVGKVSIRLFNAR